MKKVYTREDFVRWGKEGVKAREKKYGKNVHSTFGKYGLQKRWGKKKLSPVVPLA